MRRESLGSQHREVASTLNDLAMVMQAQGDYDEAEAKYREALAINRKLHRSEHPDVASALGNLAFLLSDQGAYEEAAKWHSESVAILEKTLDEGHWHTANAKAHYANCLTKLGRYQEAEELLLAAHPVFRSVMGEQNMRTQRAIRLLIELYEAWSKPEKAAEYRALLEETEQQIQPR